MLSLLLRGSPIHLFIYLKIFLLSSQKSEENKYSNVLNASMALVSHKVGDRRSPPSVTFLKAKYILPCCPSIPPMMNQFLSLSPTPPSQLAPELHCFNQLLRSAVPRSILLRTSTHSLLLARAHFHPLSGYHAPCKPPKPLLPVTAHCQPPRIRSV